MHFEKLDIVRLFNALDLTTISKIRRCLIANKCVRFDANRENDRLYLIINGRAGAHSELHICPEGMVRILADFGSPIPTAKFDVETTLKICDSECKFYKLDFDSDYTLNYLNELIHDRLAERFTSKYAKN